MKKDKMIEALNEMLAQEHACAIRYATHAAVLTGPYAETLAARLKEIAADEREHAEELREQILALDGTPTMHVKDEDLKPGKTLEEILRINMGEEVTAIRHYTEIFKEIDPSDAMLYKTIQGILADEQEHLEELKMLKSK